MNTIIENMSPAREAAPGPAPEERLLASVEEPSPPPQAERLKDRIASLPKETRDMINVMLEEGLPYRVLLDELGEAGQGLNAQHLADWVQGRYRDYLKDRETMDHARARMEFASDLLRELGEADPNLIHRACRVVAALQMFDVILEHGDSALRNMLQRNPASYINILNALCNLSNAEIKYEQKKQYWVANDR